VARVDGSNRRVVVEQMHQPAFSPDGQWLAVKGEGPNQLNLFTVRPDGRDLKRITKYLEDKLPSWSPDSDSLVLATTRDLPGRPKRIYVLDRVPELKRPQDGRLLMSGDKSVQGEYATWMPDGRIVYKGCDYTVEPQDCGLFVIQAEGGPFKRLTDNGEDTAPAAYGDRIAFTSNRDGNWDVYLMNNDGSGVKRLTQDPANDGLPAWSPDGKVIAFVSNRGGVWAVWAMNPDGSGQRKMFEVGDGGLASDWLNERISWAP
jgi:beta propeller repeat protein